MSAATSVRALDAACSTISCDASAIVRRVAETARGACEARPGEQQRAVAEPREQDERGHERDQGRGEPRPARAADGLVIAKHQQPEDDRRNPDAGEDECQGQLEAPHRVAGRAQEGGHERSPRGEVHDPEREEGDRVQPDGLLLGCHWAFVADSREASGISRPRGSLLRLQKMGRTAHCGPGARKLAWTPLGDASRGRLALETAVSTLKRPAAPTPPKQPAFSYP